MTTIKEHDRVVLTVDVPGEKLTAGDVGTVVHIYGDGKAYEVEFVSLDGETIAMVMLEHSQVRPVARGDITHARSVDDDLLLRPLNSQFRLVGRSLGIDARNGVRSNCI